MPSLLDRPSEPTLRFLRTVATGYEAAHGRWPCWQWVSQQLWDQHLDAEEILLGMPTWQYNYRPVRLGHGRQIPKINDPVPLSVHGMINTVGPAAHPIQQLIRAFLAALPGAFLAQQDMKAQPTKAVELKLDGQELTQAINSQQGTSVRSEQLFDALHAEPATWHGVYQRGQEGREWTWDLTDARLAPYAAVRSPEDYLAALEHLVAIPQWPAHPAPLPPMALPDAFDHLDLAWRLATGDKHLFRVPRAAVPAKLTQPAASVEDFESRCSALADLLKSFNFPTQGGSLNNMKTRLSELLGQDAAGRAHAAVDTLRWVFAVRAGQQHHGADADAERAKTALGLTQYGSDWAAAWDHLRAVVVQALTTIREEISPLTD